MLRVASIRRESMDGWLIDESGLPMRVVHSIRTAGIVTVGQLRAQSDQDLLALHRLGRISLGHIRSFFKLCSQIEQGKQSFKGIRELLLLFLDAPEMKVVTARYGFELEEPKASRNCLTLQKIAEAEHKTRERVRQVQETAVLKLRSRLAAVCLEPFYIFFSNLLEAQGSSTTCADVMTLGKQWPAGDYNICGVLMLLSDLHPERIAFYNNFFSTLSEQTIRTMESQAVEILDRLAKPVSLDEILKAVMILSPSNEDRKKQLLSCILEHCPLFAATLDHRYFTYESGTPAFLVEVLKDLKRPVHYRVLTKAFNDRLKSMSRKGAGFILESLKKAPLCMRVDRGVYDLKAG